MNMFHFRWVGGKNGDFLEDVLTVAVRAGHLTDIAGAQYKLLNRLTAVGADKFIKEHIFLRK